MSAQQKVETLQGKAQKVDKKLEDEVTKVKKPKPKGQLHYPFWFGGSAASMAAVCTHPLDLIKVRLQTRRADAPKTTASTFTYILKNEGPLGLYAGLSAALLRQLTYSTVRFGVYEDFKVRFAPAPDPASPDKPVQSSMLNLILMSSTSGALGGVAGNPGDILNVRMQSDKSLPVEKQRNYKNAIDGLIRMTREEGIGSLFRGVGPNSARALLMTSSQLASYDGFKRIFESKFGMGDNIGTHFLSSFLAGFVATSICNPVDVIKTRIMNAGAKQSLLDILRKAQQKEGLFWMYRGWTPSFMRLGPQTIFTMIFLEQHKKFYRKMMTDE